MPGAHHRSDVKSGVIVVMGFLERTGAASTPVYSVDTEHAVERPVMYFALVRLLANHVWKSIRFYRLTAVYLICGVAFATAQIASMHCSPPVVRQKDAEHTLSKTEILSRFRLDIGEPPYSIFRIARITIGGWFAFLGAFWDVRRRMKEWALIRLYGRHPSLIAGSHYFCLSLLGALIGGGFALLIGPSRFLDDVFWFMSASLNWGFLFSICVTIGPIAYTEFCDVAAILRIER